MKQLALAVLLIAFLFCCRPKHSEETAPDSLSVDTIALAPYEDMSVEGGEKGEEAVTEQNSETTGLEDFDYTYEGKLNKTIDVRVNIFQREGTKRARLVYLRSKKIIYMDARCPETGTFELTEKVEGKVTGIWKIAAEEEDIMSGTWSTADGSKQLPVELMMSEIDFDDFLPRERVHTGTYELKEENDDAETKQEFPFLGLEELFVKNMAGNTIFFDLQIQGPPPGVHMGVVSGMAEGSGNHYVYTNDEGCKITLSFAGDTVSLNQKGSDINCGFGANIYAYGKLSKKN